MQIAPGVTIGGKYQVEKPLARGGMGAVWVARHIKLGSPVAIKFLDAHLAAAPALVARFEREARSAANLDTPHVVHVHDYGVEDGTPYLVMELLRGEDLNARLHQRRRLSLPEAASILTQMGRALRRAHEAGIVHRDLKPANVFMARVDENEVVKVLDFGIAKETWSRVDEATKTGEVFGSPHYMSPEQARAMKDVDHRADLWATGVMAYRMITGRLPFPGEVLGEVLSSVLVDPFPPIAQVAPELPARLEGFFERALAKRKEHRFSSIGELVEAFAAATAGAGVAEAAPVDAGPRRALGSSEAPFASAPTPPAGVSPTTIADTVSEPPVPANPRMPGELPPPMATAPEAFSAMVAPPVSSDAGEAVSTQIYPPREPVTEKLSPALPEAPSPMDRTGPSIASATRSVAPRPGTTKKARAFWLVPGVLGIAALAVMGLWLTRGSSEKDQGSAAASPSSAPATLPVPRTPGVTNEAVVATPPSTFTTASQAPSAPPSVAALPAPARKADERVPATATVSLGARAPTPTSTTTPKPVDTWGLDGPTPSKTAAPEKPMTTASPKPTAVATAPVTPPAPTAKRTSDDPY